MHTTQTEIMSRIRRRFGGDGAVVTTKDFMDVASRDAVDQAFARLARRGILKRISRGLYHQPRINRKLGITVPPNANKVADALGRQTGSQVAPTPAVMANRLGLSSQVPAKHVYLTNGKTRNVKVGSQTFHLKHVTPSKLPDTNTIVGQALLAIDAIGPNPDERVIEALRTLLTLKLQHQLVSQARYMTARVADIARQVANPDHSRIVHTRE